MKRSFLLPLALVSGLLLPACGTRSSLAEPVSDTCEPWGVHDGAAGTETHVSPAFAVLDDGSVVVPMLDAIIDADGGAGIALKRQRVRKIDPDGTIAWEVVGDPEGVRFTAATRDAAGGIYVAGDAEPGATSVLGAAVTCEGTWGCSFVAKLTPTGEPSWVKAFPSNAHVWNLAVMDDGRITLGGALGGTLDLGCGPANADYANLFIARLSPSGECLWSRAIVSPQPWPLMADQMSVGDAGDVALALSLLVPGGSSINFVDFGGGPVLIGGKHDQALAVAKYAPDGALVFAKVATGGTSWNHPDVAVTDAGEVLLSASYGGEIDLGAGPRGSFGHERQFVTKFGATGEELWTHDIAADGGPPAVIALEPGGGFFLAGQGSPGMAILGEPVPKTALFAAAFDAGGTPIDVQTFPLTGNVIGLGLSASAAGALVLVGKFAGALDFGQGPLVSKGIWDAFVARICR